MNDVLVHFLADDDEVTLKDFFEATWDFLTETGEEENGVYEASTPFYRLLGTLDHTDKGVHRTLVLGALSDSDSPIELVLASVEGVYGIVFTNKVLQGN